MAPDADTIVLVSLLGCPGDHQAVGSHQRIAVPPRSTWRGTTGSRASRVPMRPGVVRPPAAPRSNTARFCGTSLRPERTMTSGWEVVPPHTICML